ncbi:hypothetical protein FZEAL_955 [Fusarium zealandicum]|uniref:Uncharacterized protein n=1 Tax=Fusarium zealandicum TaxID=1053134 RepID=A0A8H4UUG1_9HYPO|nr:hypothetical protein FZEAL_955 [Fusarium zealandicum]
MSILRQSLSQLIRRPAAINAASGRCFSPNSPRMSSDMPKSNSSTKVASDPNGKTSANQSSSDLTEGAMASLKATPGKETASGFEKQNMSAKEKSLDGQNATEPGITEKSTEQSGKSKRPS